MTGNVIEEREAPTKVKKGDSDFHTHGNDLLFEPIAVKGYEQVVKVINKKTNLKALIAIHNTELGPALGGIRIKPYANFDEALYDVLRLSKGMTYKAAAGDVGLGGGKSVIIADPNTEKTPELLLSFADALNRLKGLYIAAEDVGCTPEDVEIIRKRSKYVVGLPGKRGSGNPAPFTAWGTFRGIQSAVRFLYGSDSLEGRTVALQGLGQVGMYLANYLFWAGADLIVTDVSEERAKIFVEKYGAEYAHPEAIHTVPCDVFSPCALGGVLNARTIPNLNCRAVAGCANNQLEWDEDAESLRERNILYAPDFIINAGGLLNVTSEIEPEGYHPKVPRMRTNQIYDRLLAVYEIADKKQTSTQKAATSLAEYRIKYGIGKRTTPPHFHGTPDGL
jgi:leucine dehydrogenase